MEKLRRRSQDNWRDVVFGLIAVIVIIADQLTKWWIKSNLALGQTWRDWGFLEIVHVQNPGVSFGLFKSLTPLIIAAVFIEMLVILYIVYLLHNKLAFLDNMLLRVGAGLIMGGAIGNQIDRLAMGHVTDFINFKIWPVWNIADGSAVVGTIIVAFCILFKSGMFKTKNEQKQ